MHTQTVTHLLYPQDLTFSELNHLIHTYLHLSPFDVHLNFKPSRAPAEQHLSSLTFEKAGKFAGVMFKSSFPPTHQLGCF